MSVSPVIWKPPPSCARQRENCPHSRCWSTCHR
jgi:hypothetical protein